MSFVTHALIGNLAGGQIIVIDKNGNVRVVNEGEQLLPGEVVISGDASLVESAPNPEVSVNLVQDSGDLTDITGEIDAIFAALEEGVDPTQLGDEFATAAGGTSGSSLTPTGTIERDGVEALASTNFDTSGLESIGLSTTQSLALLNPQFSPIFVDINNDPLGESTTIVTDEDTPISGTLTATDQNTQDTLTYSQSTVPTNGTAVVNPDGTWTYTPNENYNGPDSFTVIVDDGNGGTDTLVVNIDVTPVNDAPVAEPEARSLLEDQIITGTLSATDVDLPEGESLVFTTTAEVEGLTLNPDGSYTFDASSYDRLAQGEVETIEVPITVTDDQGATDTTTLTITITGTNDDPVLTVADLSASEDGASVTGTPSFEDLDVNDTHTFTVSDMAAGQGTVSINETTGQYTYSPGTDFQSLAEGETTQVSFDVTVTDNHGGSDTKTVTVTITGTNDDPVLTVADLSASEDGASVTGTPSFEDLDVNDTHTFTVSDMAAGQGTVSINETTGQYTYSPGTDFQSLAEGETTQVSFDVTVTDNHGGSDTKTVTVTITGTNDDPVLTVADLSASEDGASVTGTPSFEDLDVNDTHTFTVSDMAAGQGTVSINETTGQYTYSPGTDFQSLAEGETTQVSFDVTVTDNHGGSDTKTVTVTITGTNDDPVLTVADLSASEDGASVTGTPSFEDLDVNDTHTFTVSDMAAGQGTVSINETTGQYTYSPGTDFQSLAEGETTQVSFDVTVTDNHGGSDTKTVTVTITGTNDDPVLTVADLSASEDGASVTGTPSFEDLDVNDTHTFTVSDMAAGQGTVSINETTGQYTYSPGTDFQSLAEGETTQVSFDVTVTDNHGGSDTKTVTVTITGTNDDPVLTVADLSASEDGASVTGTPSFEDLDVNDTHTFTVSDMAAGQGTVSINETTGQYTYNPGTDFQSLAEGETTQVSFDVTVTDNHGGSDTKTVTVTITGTNDDPVLTVADLSASEDGASVTGTPSFEDLDVNDTHTFTVSDMAAGQGTVSINETTGQYTYNPGTDFQSLAEGETTQVSFDVTVTDNHGGSDTKTVTVTITGTNDDPVLTVADLSASEDGASVTGTPSFEDLDVNDTHTFTVSDMAAGQGTVSINETTGQYTYNPGTDFQSLAEGETTQVSFDVTVTDNHGGSDTKTVTVTITGTNDDPVLTVADLSASEDGASVTGTPSFEDLDVNDTHTFTVSDMAAGQGTVSINETTGQYTYNPGTDFQSLAEGETTQVSFDVTVTDNHGGSDTKTVTVTITGTNDDPVLTVADLSASEDGASVTGTPSFEDLDVNDTHTFTVSDMAAGQGTVSINETTGQYTYNPGTDFQSLAEGETTQVSFDVTVTDNHGGSDTKTVTVTITGTNDDPVLTVADLSASEDGASVTGTPSFEDLDVNDTHTFTVSDMAAGQGTVSINETTGQYTYSPGTDFQSLAEGETTQVSFDVTVTDNHGGSDTKTVTVTITGTNDDPVLTVADLSASEDGASVTGTPSFEDLDVNDTHTFTVSDMAAGQGTVSINETTGQYTYSPGTDFQSLAEGETTQVSFDVTVTDNHGGSDTKTVTVTITGTNDDPVLTVADLSASEDGASVTGTPSFEDLDVNDTHTFTVSDMAAGQGTVSINETTGQYTYSPGTDFQSLAEGETTQVSFDVTVTDNHGGSDTKTVTVTITGTNDDPVLTVADLSASEDGASVTGTPSFEDLDVNDTHTFTVSDMAAGQGTVSINETTGQYTYSPGTDFQSLAEGETTQVSFDVTVTDNHGGSDTKTVTVTITGTNDDPVLTVADLSASEDGASVTGTPSFEDLDVNDTHTFTVSDMAAGQGTVSINETTGQYTYSPGTDFQSLAEGETTQVSFDVTVTDNHGGSDTKTVTVTITGTNDDPVLTVADLSASEDGASVTGTPSFEDLDVNDTHTFTVSDMAAGQGTVSINETTGQYTYSPGTDFQSLAEGETTQVSFDVTVTDNHGGSDTKTVTVTITGTNDDPVLTVADLSASEDGASVTGTPSFEDLDVNDTHTFTVSDMAAGQGTVSINETTGQYTYNPGTDFQSLAEGETTQVSFDVTVTDNHGGSDTKTVTVTITGTNDDPVLTVADLSASEDGASVTGTPSFEDLDVNDTHTFTVSDMAAGQGTVSINETTGQYTYSPGTDFQSLAEGETTQVSFDVTVTDNHGGSDTKTVTVTITGTNDDPVLTVADLSASEDGASVTGTPSFEDLDVNDTHTFTVSDMAAGQGTVSINETTGQYTYSPGTDFQSLAEGETTQVSFDVTVTDNHGGSDTKTVTVTITGTNDDPVLTVADLSASEDGASVTGTPSFEDLDVNDTHIFTVSDMAAGQGTVSINETTGQYTYNPGTDFQSLAEGETTQVSFDVTVTDNHGGSDTKTVTVTITGTNDDPVLTVADLSASEDGASVTGTPSFEDLDVNDTHIFTVSDMAAGQGTVSINETTGQYTYNPGTDFQSLAEGETTQVSFDVTVTDNHGGSDTKTVTVTITGTNDDPVLTVADLSASEDGASVTGTPSFEDLDVNDTHTFTVSDMAAGQGTVSINETTGQYTYSPGTDFQSLAEGETTQVSFDVTVTDNHGGSDTKTVTVTITGTNDDPVLTVADLSASEDGASVTGTPSFEDLDVNDTHTFTVSDMAAGQGTVSINETTGQYTYNPGTDFQSLAEGETTQVSFDVTVTDNHGGSDTKTVTVTITGTNDDPVLTVADLSASEDGASVTGTPSFEDLDVNDTHTFTVSDMAAGQGTVSINETTGQYTYSPGTDFQSLAEGETTQVSFDVTVTDNHGGSDTKTVTVTITGTNDDPVLTVADLSASEDGASVTGTPSFEDLDVNDTHTFTVSDMAAGQGTVSINETTGQYTYNPGTDFQSLAEGETTQVSFDVTVTDNHGGSDTKTVTVTITGTNDDPVLTVADLSASEDGASVTGTPSFEDLDVNDTHTFTVSDMAAGQGTVSINETTGQYTYSPGTDFQSLAEGETTQVSFDVTVTDNHGGSDTKTVTVTITGTNDDPVLTVADLSASEDGASVTGTPSFEDLDVNDTHTFTVSDMAAGQGTVSINETTGQYTYSPGTDFQSLAEGETTQVSFDVTVTDNHGGSDTKTVTVTITGTNDDPVLTVADLSASEDGASVTGTPSFEDLDVNDTHTFTVSDMAAGQGTVSINETTGQYTYSPGTDFQSLAEGETTQVSFDVTVTDNHGGSDTKTVTVTITGTNDDPVLTVADLSASEDGASVTGTPSFEDLDVNDTHTFTVSDMAAGQGTVSINETTGQYTYSPGTDFQSLAEGETTQVSFDVTVTDNHGGSDTKTVTVTITGTNDDPVLTVADLSASEDGASVTGTPSFEDLDVNDTHTFTVSDMAAGQGTVSINETTGQYTYSPGTDFQSLAEGETTQVSFDVTVTDNHGGSDTKTVTVTITGTNDDPVLTVADLSASEDGASVTGTPSFEDLDVNDTHTFTVSDMAAGQGTVSINETTGQYTYNPGTDFQSLAEGETTQVSFDVTVTDNHGGSDTKTVTVTITGTNDDPVLTVADLSASEDGASVTGTPSFEDLDVNDTHTFTVSDMAAGQGTVSINETTGQYTYNPGTDFQSLAEGETTQVSFDVTVTDNHGGSDTKTVTVTITGTNDDPVLTVADLSASEDGASVTGTPSFEDLDVNDTHTFTVSDMAAGQGTVSINETTGQYTYSPGTDFQSLAEGETTQVSFDVTVTDNHGGSDTKTVTVTITGTNDDPVLTVADLSASEDGASVTGTPSFEDLDVNDTHTFTVSDMAAGQGTVSINETTGQYTYSPGTDFQSLAEGETTQVSFDVTVTDNHGGSDTKTVTVTITGTNDDPVLTVADLSASEDGASVTGTPSFEDLDVNDTHTFTVSDMAAGQGTVSINETTGQYTYSPGTDFQSLAEGETTQVSFDVTVTDNHGGSDTKTVTVTITGTNDDPVLTVADLSASEDGASVTGTPSFEDLDVNDTHTFTVSDMAAGQGTVSINETTGQYTYSPGTDFQSLAEGETTQVSFDVTVTDNHGGSDTKTVTVTITGTNDVPIAVDDYGKGLIFHESFEESGLVNGKWDTFADYNGWTITNSDGDKAELEIQTGNVGGSSASDGNAHAELDGHELVSISRDLDTKEGSTHTVTFDYKPRPNYEGDSGLTATFGDTTVVVVSDPNGNIVVTSGNGVQVEGLIVTQDPSNGWYTIAFDETVSDSTTTLSFTGTGSDNTFGAYIDNISVENTSGYQTQEDTEIRFTPSELLANDTDPDGDELSIVDVVSRVDGNGTVDLIDGEIVFTPNKDFNGVASYDYVIADPSGERSTATVFINVTPVNDPPVANNDGHTLGDNLIVNGSFEDFTSSNSAPSWGDRASSLDGWVFNTNSGSLDLVDDSYNRVETDLDHFIDMEGEGSRGDNVTLSQTVEGVEEGKPYQISLDIAAKGNNHTAQLQVVWNGVVIATITPDGNSMETHTFEVTGALGDNTISFVEVGGKGDNSGTYLDNIKLQEILVDLTTDEDTTLEIPHSQLLVNDFDIDGDDIAITSVSITDPSHGKVEIVDGKVVFEPAENFNGVTTFEYEISDRKGGTDTAIVAINVKPINDAPEFVDDKELPLGDDETISTSTKEDASVSGKVKATDADGDDLTYTADKPSNGEVDIDADGNWTYTPDPEFDGKDSFVITVSDGNGGTDTITVNVDVLPVAELTVSAGQPVTEGDESYLSFEINLDELVSENVGLDLTLGATGDTATKGIDYEDKIYVKDGNDYKALTADELAALVIEQGKDSIEVFVKVIDDSLLEGEETVTLKVSSSSEYVEVPGNDSAEAKIIDETVTTQKDTVTVTLEGPSTVTEGDITTPFTITLSEAVPEKSVITLEYSYTNADNQDIVEVIEVEIAAGSKTANFTIETVQDNEYEQGQQFNVSVVSVKHDDKDVFEQLDTASANRDVVIDDSKDNPPESEDFSINVGESGTARVIFNDGNGSIEGDGSDHISDNEDDNDNNAATSVGVVITELPDHGVLKYGDDVITKDDLAVFDENGNLVKEGKVFEDPNLIEYIRSENSEGFLLGVKDEQDVDSHSPSTNNFHNWGEATDDPSVRKLTLADGDVITVTGSKQGNGDNNLVQYNQNANHVGYGIGVGQGNGIQKGETVSINFDSRPADRITLGLDGLGSYFDKDLNNGNESKVTILVTWVDADNNVHNSPFEYQKDTSGNTDLFHEVTIPSDSFMLPDGAMIQSVDLSTEGKGNWELRYIDTRSDDSFDYRAIDSDKNYSEESTVTINNVPDANDDPQTYTVQLGTFAEDRATWNLEGVTVSGYVGKSGDFSQNANTSKELTVTDGYELGVEGSINGGPAAQLQYNRATGESEKIAISLPKPATSFSFAVSHLVSGEGAAGEQGMWTAYLDGKPVQSGVFSLESGHEGTFNVDLGDVAFDTVVFEATDFVEGEAKQTDSSDYFLVGFEATGTGAYAVNQSEGEIRIPISEILSNDIDLDGDELKITGFGDQKAYIDGDYVVFDFDDTFSGKETFEYTISDGNGGTDTANITIIVNPDVPAVSVGSIDVDANQVNEGESLSFTVNLSNSSTISQLLAVKFGVDPTQEGNAGNQDVDLSKATFTNGVTYNAYTGELFVPPNVDSFKIVIPTVLDGDLEPTEIYNIEVGGVPVSGTILNDNPPEVDLNGIQYQIDMVSESASHSNVFGYYIWDSNTGTAELNVLIGNTNSVADKQALALLNSLDNVEFFLLSDGAGAIEPSDVLTVDADGKLFINGSESGQTAYFSHVDAHKLQFQISEDKSEIKIEDLPVNSGDKDYNDLVIAIRPINDGIDYSTTYIEGKSAVTVADVDADIFDDHNLISSISIRLTNGKAGDQLDDSLVDRSKFSVTNDPMSGLLLITELNGGSLAADEFEAALKAITFSNTSDDPDNTDRVIEVTVTDDKGQLSAVAETTIKVIDYNPDGTLDNQVEGAEDAVLLLSLNDFGIQSGDGLKITSSPNNVFFKNVGTSYEPDWQPISSSQVTSALIESGIIGFKALEHESGFNGFNDTLVGNTHGDYARVGFEVTIDGQTSSHTLTVEITPVADAPIVTITLDDIRQSNALFPYPTDKDSILELHASGKLLNVNGDIFQGTHDQDNGFLEASNRDSNLFIAQDKYPGAPGTPEQPLAVHYTGNYKGSDVFIGGSLDDTFKGANSDSDHTFNDHLGYDDNGEEIRAIDTVIYEGSISDFTITYEQVEGGNRFRVINTNGTETSLPSETGAGDTLYFIEQVIFSDGIVKLDNENGTATVVKSSMMPLTIDVELQDKDGSEHLVDNRVEIAGIPVGVELYVGGVKVDPVLENNGLQTFNITVDLNKDNNFSTTIDTTQLKVTPNYTGSLDFTVTACAVAQDHNGSQATGSDSEFATFATDKFIVDNSSEQQLLGYSADDVIIGDVGGIDITITPAKNYNIAILADVSGSMKEGFDGSTRLGVMKAALMSFVEGLDTHSGAINIALIGFSSSASAAVSISDIQDNNWSALEAAINLLSADGATNYEAAFDSAKNWFDSLGDSSTDADNLTLFVTDGKPTTYTGDSSISGGRTDDEDLSKAITAYNELTAISKVKAIGIATDSSETHILRMFDNTNIVDSDYADIRQVSSIVEQTIDIVVSGKDDPKTVTGNEFNIGINQSASLVLDFSITEQLGKNDTFLWNIEKLAGDQWETSVEPFSSTSDMSIEIIDAGTYRLALYLDNGSSGRGELDGVKLDATISIFESTQVPLGQVEVVTSGDQLVAVLEGEISYITYREMDSDHILGGRGDDIISGDAINTDYLPWEDVGSPAEKSLGLDGLKQFLTLRNGFEPSDEELHQFVVENHDTFKLFEETLDDTNSVLGQSDTLDGGMGSDILYGQGGDDTLIGRLGDDILTGGEGADIFKWVDGDLDGSVDVIKDFSKDEGDKIDLSELFEGDDRSVDDIISQYVKVEDTDADDNHAEIVVTKGDDRVTIELEGWNSADLTDQLKDILIIKD